MVAHASEHRRLLILTQANQPPPAPWGGGHPYGAPHGGQPYGAPHGAPGWGAPPPGSRRYPHALYIDMHGDGDGASGS